MSELTTADTNDSAQIPKPIGAAGANAAGATDAAGSAPKIFIIPSLKQLLGRADIGFAFAIMAILTVMILRLSHLGNY